MANDPVTSRIHPKISGFTLIRNGVEFDFPFLESLRSLLPLVDELIVNVGRGTDSTLELLEAFARNEGNGKVELFESTWPLDDPEKKQGGCILSAQTNLALDRCTGDWCVYLQADEVLHEEDQSKIQQAIHRHHPNPKIEGLVFDYLHFYGSYDVVQHSRSVYRREVRAIRRLSGARSIGDAQSFRKQDGSKLTVAHANARIFHYGWVRTPEAMREKTFFMDQLYHGDPSTENQQTRTPFTGDNYRYKRIIGLYKCKSTHPQVMLQRIQEKGWHWDLEHSSRVWTVSDLQKIILNFIEKATGKRLFEYRSYILDRSNSS
ncbi:glycosyltransferase family 2 protein [Bdellovibrionota bacterium FG-2]